MCILSIYTSNLLTYIRIQIKFYHYTACYNSFTHSLTNSNSPTHVLTFALSAAGSKNRIGNAVNLMASDSEPIMGVWGQSLHGAHEGSSPEAKAQINLKLYTAY